MNLQKIEPAETGINLFFDTHGIFVPYEVERPTWERAVEIAAERGHTLPTIEQGIAVIENRAKIDEALKAAGKPVFDDWFWLDRDHSTDPRFAWCAYMINGVVGYYRKFNTLSVRAVSAFRLE